jgi:hypothetical protein
MANDTGTWTAFLLAAIGAVGLVGAAGIVGAQVPYQHAIARNDALTQALAVASGPDAAARLDALRPALDDSAERVLNGQGDLLSRVTAERVRVSAEFSKEAHDIRVRMLIGLAAFTAGAGIFGAFVLSVVARKAEK